MRVAYHNPVGLFICGLFYVSVSKTIINNKQGDLYQVLEYARKRDIQDVYLLYPMYRYEEKEKEFPVAVSESPSGDINVHFIRSDTRMLGLRHYLKWRVSIAVKLIQEAERYPSVLQR